MVVLTRAARQGGGAAAVERGRRRQGAVGATVTGAVGATVTGAAVVEVRAAVDCRRPHSPGGVRVWQLVCAVCGSGGQLGSGVGGRWERGEQMVQCGCGEGNDVIDDEKC